MSSTVQKMPHSSEKELWDDVMEYLPKAYSLSKGGVYLNKDSVLISGPCWVTALTRSEQGDDWGLVLHWIDQDGGHRHKAFPINRIQESRSAIATDLATFGLKVVTTKHTELKEYIGSFDLPKSHRLQSISKLGWLFNEDGSMVYVFPDEVVSIERVEDIIFQPEEHSPTTNTMKVHGSLENWSKYVAAPCRDNPVLIFGLCTSFASSLLAFAGLEGGGFHFFGTSSKGKTTLLQVAASVWGNGSDPGASENSHVGRWNTTANALEGTAAAHNDSLLALDEMGVCNDDLGKIVYDLSSGLGKARSTKNSTLRKQLTWRTLILSTGEISVKDKIIENNKKPLIGQEVRMVDISIGDGVVVQTHGKKPDKFANSLKRKSGQYYGVAGYEFIKMLIEYQPNHFAMQEYIRNQLEYWKDFLSQDRKLESFQQRVIQRFALSIVAGHLAVKFDLLPMAEEDITNSVMSVLDSWLSDESNLPPVLRGINELKGFFQAYKDSRFKNLVEPQFNYSVNNIAGYIKHENTEKCILFTKAGFKEACNGYDPKSVLQELKQRNYLIHEKNKLYKKVTLAKDGDKKERIAVHVVRLSFLYDDISE